MTPDVPGPTGGFGPATRGVGAEPRTFPRSDEASTAASRVLIPEERFPDARELKPLLEFPLAHGPEPRDEAWHDLAVAAVRASEPFAQLALFEG